MSAPADSEAARREALRKKGQEFLEKAVKQASTRSTRPGDVRLNVSTAAPQPIDPALETVGVVVEGMRLYLAALVFIVSSGASLVLAKASLTYLHTPATAVFLHMLTAVLVLLVLSYSGELSLGPLNVPSLQSCLPEVICSGVQMLCLFGLLYRESVYVVAVWVTLAPQVLQIATDVVSRGKRPRALQLLLLALGIVLGGCTMAAGLAPGSNTVSLVFLTLWAMAELGQEFAAKALHSSGLAQAEAGPFNDPPSKPTVTLYKNALAALPVLVVGLVFKEGSALTRLELSVPTLTMLLLSCAAWGLAASTQLIVAACSANLGFQLLLTSLSSLGILVAQVAVMGVGSVTMLLLSLAAVVCSICMLWASAGAQVLATA